MTEPLASVESVTPSHPAGDVLCSRIDWGRIAKPQSDQYDSIITLQFARERGFRPHADRQPNGLFGGTVHIVSNTYWQDPDQFASAPPDHPNVRIASELIRSWPEAFSQCAVLLSTVHVSRVICPSGLRGSVSGPGPTGFGSVCVSVNDPFGTAEAIVHEMAHHKLRAIGIGLTSAERLIANPAERLYPSPIRYDTLRPMTAVIHAAYSYSYVTSLDLAVIGASGDSAAAVEDARATIAYYLPKLRFGREVIASCVRTDAGGAKFITGYLNWLDELLDRGFELLRQLEVSPVAFEHPLRPRPSWRW